MPKLVYHDSSGTRGTVEMGAETILIGRAADCQIQTQDGLVSRRHARVSYDGAYWIEDNGSANGVYVGSERVQRYKLRPGDVFRCGHLEVRFEVEDMNRTSVNAAPSAGAIAQAAAKAVPVGPAPPPANAMIFGVEGQVGRGASGRSTPSAASVPPPVGMGESAGAAPAKMPAGASGIVAPPPLPQRMPMNQPADPTGSLRAGSGQKLSPSATSIPPPPPSPYPYPEPPAPTQMERPPAPPSRRGFPDVSPVTNVPRSSQSIPPPPPPPLSVPNELATIRSELEGERQRRIEVERERDEALRRADDATQQAQESQLQAQDALRKADELSSRVTDGDSERLRRRIEQLESELRRKGGGGGGGGEALRTAEAERDRLRAKVAELEARPAPAPAANADQEMELIRFRRKVEQLESDLRRARSGQPEDKGPDPRVAELQAEVRRLAEERDAAVAASKAAAAAGDGRHGSSEELERAKRRIDQLESEARRRPVGSVSDEKRMEAQRAEVESVLRQLRDTERERDSLRELVSRSGASAGSGPAKPPQAVVDNLTTVSDGLADMRAALRAAGDDLALETLEQVRKALRQACTLLGLSI